MCVARTDARGVAAALIAASLATTARAGESNYTSIAEKACRELGTLKIERYDLCRVTHLRRPRRLQNLHRRRRFA